MSGSSTDVLQGLHNPQWTVSGPCPNCAAQAARIEELETVVKLAAKFKQQSQRNCSGVEYGVWLAARERLWAALDAIEVQE